MGKHIDSFYGLYLVFQEFKILGQGYIHNSYFVYTDFHLILILRFLIIIFFPLTKNRIHIEIFIFSVLVADGQRKDVMLNIRIQHIYHVDVTI